MPTIVVDGTHDTLRPPKPRHAHATLFPALVDHRGSDAGHDPPQETPAAFAHAITDLWATF